MKVGDFLLHMKSYPFYDDFEKQLLSNRPLIPSHKHTEDNTEQWKFESAKQEGFDLCLTYFNIEVPK